jgi:DNA polymerase-3 subunit alpha
MTIEMDDTDKLKIFHDDATLFGITFSPPDVNEGTYRFEPLENKRVRYALGAVKGTGQSASRPSCEAREEGAASTASSTSAPGSTASRSTSGRSRR